jgi:dolichyl-diphosphooligosaccharide--protein glycosyltransferase/undecaprenyl-diphosphooligosaccharide--protein glycosyltransferase
MNKDIFKLDNISTKQILLLMLLAYFFSFAIRMIWVIWASNNMGFFWNGELMINTNDGYHFATGAEYLLSGKYGDNPKVLLSNHGYLGLQYTTYLLAKYTPFSLDTIILYLPAVVSSLIVIPIILTGTLLRLPWVGFFSALIASITWSYYNRTMAGYYDSDMFAVFLQFTIFYLFLLTIYTKENKNILWLAFALLVYPYFYPQGLTITYAMFIFWMMYQLLFQRNEKNSYLFIIIASIALWSIAAWIKLLLIIGIFISLIQIKNKLDYKTYFYLVLVALLTLFLFNHIFELILKMTNLYLDRGLEQSGLHFYQVIQTVREAGKISWETVSNRITGHPILLALGLVGYIVLVVRHKPFIIALPLIGVGVFAHWAGLRFTVYAVPITVFSLVYLFYFITQYIKNKKTSYTLFVTLCLFAIYPNISHIIGYKVPTVLNATEVQDLAKLNEIADVKDYTLAWWDYGYPIWYYSETSTLSLMGGNTKMIISSFLK